MDQIYNQQYPQGLPQGYNQQYTQQGYNQQYNQYPQQYPQAPQQGYNQQYPQTPQQAYHQQIQGQNVDVQNLPAWLKNIHPPPKRILTKPGEWCILGSSDTPEKEVQVPQYQQPPQGFNQNVPQQQFQQQMPQQNIQQQQFQQQMPQQNIQQQQFQQQIPQQNFPPQGNMSWLQNVYPPPGQILSQPGQWCYIGSSAPQQGGYNQNMQQNQNSNQVTDIIHTITDIAGGNSNLLAQGASLIKGLLGK